MVIDAHIHPPLRETRKSWDRILSEATKNGINLMIASHLGDWSDYPDAETISHANKKIKLFCDYAGERVKWLAYLNPQLSNWKEELLRALKNGASGIKLWISLKDTEGNLTNTIEVLQEAGRQKVPVLMHVYNRTDDNRPGEISIQDFIRISNLAPDCVMIAAHAGGNWRHSMEMLRNGSSNTYMDISGGYPEQGMVDSLVKSEGNSRILFGSDAWGRSFPSQIAKILFAEIDTETKDKILWKNAAKVFVINNIPELPTDKPALRNADELPDFSEDHFCFCGNWPFFESPCRTPEKLTRILETHHISKAFAADLGSMFRLDLLDANRKFLDACSGLDNIKPLAILNPEAHNWCKLVDDAATGSYAGGLIAPYLHNWQIDAPQFKDFFCYCAKQKVKLWINCSLSDHRFRHKAFSPNPVCLEALRGFMVSAPENNYIFQGMEGGQIEKLLEEFNNTDKFKFELSRLTDSMDTLRNVLDRFGKQQLVAGSEFPFRHIGQVKYAAERL